MRAIRYIIISAAFVGALLTVVCCKVTCGAFPNSELVWFPQLKVGESIIYSDGEKEIVFKVDDFYKSKEYSQPMMIERMCMTHAYMHLFAINPDVPLTDTLELDYLVSDDFMIVICKSFIFYKSAFEDSKQEDLPNCIKIGDVEIDGTLYTNVWMAERAHSDDGNETLFNMKKIYYTKGYGVVRFETADGKVWDLKHGSILYDNDDL